MTIDSEILFEVSNELGTIILNRPRALNALTMNMIVQMRTRYTEWLSDDGIKAILIKGAGDRAFCAGGDVRAIRQAIIEYQGKTNPDLAQEFFFEEYILNHQIQTASKPYIALMDRVCMGGGVGLSVHGSFRVVTERTTLGMPETTIGLFPDVGGAWFLSRLPGFVGTYLALTGIPISSRDCLDLGIATHVVHSKSLPDIEMALREKDDTGNTYVRVQNILNKYVIEIGDASLPAIRSEIDSYFSASTVEEIIKRLKDSGSIFSKRALETIALKSPTSLKVTLEQIRRGRCAKSFSDTMTMEYRLSQHFARGHDFPEGVRAVLIDKDHKPNWNPDRLETVTDEVVAGYFERVPWRELSFD